ncbi:uncharacterized protein LOC113331930 [Papaver somniferum]|uniref:uncharacterized protein LOC113331930 n=1 Tax=Papaver somniferum TaxID=3469 RepID=UPI000E6FD154|nr:uncharacterized protein LOC113331930 [Papaver somniferum]
MSTSSGNNYDYYYSSSSSSSSDEDSKASVDKSEAKTTHDEGEKSSVPLNDRRVTYAELIKRKAEDDEAENRQRRRDRIRRRVQADEERRQFLDGVPSDSDADVSEEETAWVFTECMIKPDRYEREFRRTMKQIEAEAEAEEDSDSDDDLEARPYFIPDADSDEEEDSDGKSDESDDEKDSDDESGNSDESDDSNISSQDDPQSKREIEASISDNQKNSSSHNSRPKGIVRALARYRSAYAEADVRVVVDARRRRSGKSVTVVDVENSSTRVGEDSAESVEIEHMVHAREYPTAGLSFEAPMINNFPDNEVVGGFVIFKWDEMISNCEILRFNVGWIRHRIEIIKIHKATEAADTIFLTTALLEEEKMLALESARVEKAVQELRTKTKSFQKKLDRVAYRDYPLLDGFL